MRQISEAKEFGGQPTVFERLEQSRRDRDRILPKFLQSVKISPTIDLAKPDKTKKVVIAGSSMAAILSLAACGGVPQNNESNVPPTSSQRKGIVAGITAVPSQSGLISDYTKIDIKEFPLRPPEGEKYIAYKGGPHKYDQEKSTELNSVDLSAIVTYKCDDEKNLKRWPVRAMGKGKVRKVLNSVGTVIIDLGRIYPKNIKSRIASRSAHLGGIRVEEGDVVNENTIIADMISCNGIVNPLKKPVGPHTDTSFIELIEDGNGNIIKEEDIKITDVRIDSYEFVKGSEQYEGLAKKGNIVVTADAGQLPPGNPSGKTNYIEVKPLSDSKTPTAVVAIDTPIQVVSPTPQQKEQLNWITYSSSRDKRDPYYFEMALPPDLYEVIPYTKVFSGVGHGDIHYFQNQSGFEWNHQKEQNIASFRKDLAEANKANPKDIEVLEVNKTIIGRNVQILTAALPDDSGMLKIRISFQTEDNITRGFDLLPLKSPKAEEEEQTIEKIIETFTVFKDGKPLKPNLTPKSVEKQPEQNSVHYDSKKLPYEMDISKTFGLNIPQDLKRNITAEENDVVNKIITPSYDTGFQDAERFYGKDRSGFLTRMIIKEEVLTTSRQEEYLKKMIAGFKKSGAASVENLGIVKINGKEGYRIRAQFPEKYINPIYTIPAFDYEGVIFFDKSTVPLSPNIFPPLRNYTFPPLTIAVQAGLLINHNLPDEIKQEEKGNFEKALFSFKSKLQ